MTIAARKCWHKGVTKKTWMLAILQVRHIAGRAAQALFTLIPLLFFLDRVYDNQAKWWFFCQCTKWNSIFHKHFEKKHVEPVEWLYPVNRERVYCKEGGIAENCQKDRFRHMWVSSSSSCYYYYASNAHISPVFKNSLLALKNLHNELSMRLHQDYTTLWKSHYWK